MNKTDKKINKNKGLRQDLFCHRRVNSVVTVSDFFLEFNVIVST